MMKSTAKLGVALLALLGLGVVLRGAQQQRPVFRADTRLVEVTVTVVDKKGNGVAGLEASDFQVFDQGKPRTVELFRFEGGPAAPTAAALPPGVFSNLPAFVDDAPRNVAALVLDNINTTALDGVTARAQIMRYLKTLAPHTTTAVYLMARQLYILHDFTDDAAALRARLENATLPSATAWEMDERQSVVHSEAFLRTFEDDGGLEYDLIKALLSDTLRTEAMADAAVRRDRLQRTLAQMERLGMHLAGIPGRKSLVWIGGGFSWVSITATTPKTGQLAASQKPIPELLDTLENEVRQVARRLAQQGVVLYIVDAHRIEAPSDVRAQSPQSVPQRGRGNFEMLMDMAAVSSDPQPTMQAMASITGGRYFLPGDLDSGAGKVLSDLQGSYTLGFYVTEKPDDKWHKLKVQVKRSGVNVRHREGYLSDPQLAQPAKWTEDTWRSALSNPLISPAIPLTVTCTSTPSGELAVSVSADTRSLQFVPDGESLKANLEVLVADRTPQGPGRATRSEVTSTVPAAQLEAAREQPTRYEVTWKPAADAIGLRVIVHDVNSGQHGSVDIPLSKVARQDPH